MVASAGAFARSTDITVQQFKVKASTSITIGQAVALDASGHAEVATASAGDTAKGLFCALETVDNSSGSAGDKNIRVAGGNSFVYMTSSGAIKVGSTVKPANAGKVQADSTALGANVILGRYFGKENETVPSDASADEVVIVRLGL